MTTDPETTCENTRDNLVAYVQDELGDHKLARRIKTHLAECEICKRQVAEIRKTFQMARETYHEFIPSEQVWEELLERLHSPGSDTGQGAVHGIKERLAPEPPSPPPVSAPAPEARVVPRNRRMISAVISVAAVLVLVAGAVLLLNWAGFKVILKNGSKVSALLPGDDRWVEIEPGRNIKIGTRVKVDESASFAALLEYPDGSTIEAAPGTELEIVAEKIIKLDRGELTADIVIPAGAGFRVNTEFGDIEVMGTMFTVSVSRENMSTRIRVHKGKVCFSRDGVRRIIEAGYESWAGKEMPPREPQAVRKSSDDEAFLTRETLKVTLSVYDGSKYRNEMDLDVPRIPSDAPLRVRFEVKNTANAVLTLPTGRTGGWRITLARENMPGGGDFLRRDVTTTGKMLGDNPSTTPEEKEVRIGPGEVYQFEYEIPLERLQMFKGRRYILFGDYYFVSSPKFAVEVK